MALNTLTLGTTTGILGSRFSSSIGGKSAGTVVTVKSGAPGFGVANGVLSTLSLPYVTSSVVLNERNPATGESQDTTVVIGAIRLADVMRDTQSQLGYRPVRFRSFFTQSANGDGVWSYAYETQDGATSSAPVNTVIQIPLTIMFIGSSTPQKYFDTFTGPANDQVTSSADGTTFAALGTTGAGATNLGNNLNTITGRPIRFIKKGVSGTKLSDWEAAGDANRAAAVSAGNNAKANGGLDAIVCIVGFNDVYLDSSVTSQAAHEAKLRSLFSKLRSELGLPNIPIMVGVSQAMVGQTPTAAQDQQLTWVRAAEMAVSKDSLNGFYAHSVDLPTITNDFHMNAASYVVHAARGARNIAAKFGVGTASRGPSIVSGVGVDNSTTDVTIVHDGGNDFTPTTGISSFLVSFDGFSTSVTPSSVSRLNSTTVRVTHVSGSGAAAQIAHLRGALPNRTAVLVDNQSPSFNLSPTETFITASAPPVTPPAPSPNILDTFTDTDNVLLTAHSSDSPAGGTWANDSGSFSITSNRARGGARPSQVVHSYSPTSANYDVEGDFTPVTVLTNANDYLVFRRAGATSYMVAGYTAGTGKWEIGITNTSYVALGGTAVTLVAGTTYRLRLEARGSTFTLFVNDVQTVQATDTALAAAGRVGLRSSGAGSATSATTGVHWDNFKLTER